MVNLSVGVRVGAYVCGNVKCVSVNRLVLWVCEFLLIECVSVSIGLLRSLVL